MVPRVPTLRKLRRVGHRDPPRWTQRRRQIPRIAKKAFPRGADAKGLPRRALPEAGADLAHQARRLSLDYSLQNPSPVLMIRQFFLSNNHFIPVSWPLPAWMDSVLPLRRNSMWSPAGAPPYVAGPSSE